jgi:tRNA(Ile)-lysidine synthase
LHALLAPYLFTEPVVNDILQSLDKHPGRQFFSATYRLLLDREQLILSPLVATTTAPTVQITPEDKQITFANYQLHITQQANSANGIQPNAMLAQLDADLITYPLTLRYWQPGDYFYPLGMRGKKKLSDFFISLKIPVHQKSMVPVLADAHQQIIWVCGLRADNRYKVSISTKKVIIFELINLHP